MNFRTIARSFSLTIVLAAMLSAGATWAGTISVAWDPVTHPDLVGYRVHYGPTSSYGQSTDTGLTTAVTLTGLSNCTDYHVAVKARASDGSESTVFSNEILGWGRPEASSFSPSTVQRGATLNVTIGGTNFQSGAAVDFGDPAVTVNSVSVNSCSQIVANITVGASANLGPADFDVNNPDTVFGTGSGLFSVINDSSGPAISAVASSSVNATSADLTWTTDEPADSQIFYRVVGQTAYQSTAVDTSLVTSHSVTLTGLMPETDYEYYVQSADASANTSTSTPLSSFTTTSSSFVYLRVEAESGILDPQHDLMSGSGAFGGQWVQQTAGSSNGTPSNPTGTSDYGFFVPTAGTWYIWVRSYGPSATADSIFESVDGGSFGSVVNSTTGSWEWLSAASYSLAAGQHTLTLGGREATTRVDRFLITDDPTFQPTEQPGADTVAPASVSSASAVAGDGFNTLGWTNPGNGDLERIVIRYRTDGSFPTSPVDGTPLYDAAAAPGAGEGHVHNGLTNGTTYSYSVFSIDSSGNASLPTNLTATPQAPPLGQVTNLRRTDTQ